MTLFNLEDDKGEMKNMASSRKDITNQLLGLLEKMGDSIVTEDSRPTIHDGRDTDENGYVRSGWCNL